MNNRLSPGQRTAVAVVAAVMLVLGAATALALHKSASNPPAPSAPPGATTPSAASHEISCALNGLPIALALLVNSVNPADAEADVKHVQTWLNALPRHHGGAEPKLTVDGTFGNEEASAVREFQRAKGFPLADGIVGKETWRTLCVLSGGTGVTAAVSCEFHGLPWGRVNTANAQAHANVKPQIKQLQTWLNVTPINGTFDEKTEQAVQNLQTKQRLTPDGLVGPKTWHAACTQR